MKAKNNVTEIVFILDKSGSMSGFEADTVGGFNSTLKRQRGEEGKAYVSTLLFNTYTEVIHDRVPIENVPLMTENDFVVSGCTALLDALGGAIKHISNIHKYARAEDVPSSTIFIIMTDGMENASREYNSATVKRMISEKQEKGWEFIFLAANIDAVETADSIGIRRDRASNYRQDKKGVKASYDAMYCAITRVRRGDSLDDGDWRTSLDVENGEV